MTTLDWAMRYHRAGLTIMPCRGKTPILNRWQNLTHANTTLDLIHAWFHSPDTNIGLICGHASGITVVDCDWIKEDGKIIVEKSEHPERIANKLPPSMSSITGSGGIHRFFRYANIKNSTKGVHPQIDIKSDGGFVVLPPSIHPDTKLPYAWHPMFTFDESNLGDNLAEIPEWIIEASSKVEGSVIDYDAIFSSVGYGQRNDRTAMLSGRVIQALRFAPNLAWEFIQWWNRNKVSPPLDEGELWRTFQSILKRDIRNNPKDYGTKK